MQGSRGIAASCGQCAMMQVEMNIAMSFVTALVRGVAQGGHEAANVNLQSAVNGPSVEPPSGTSVSTDSGKDGDSSFESQ